MQKKFKRKLVLNKANVRRLDAGELGQIQGAYYTESPGCVFSVPRSFCVCPTKHICSINC